MLYADMVLVRVLLRVVCAVVAVLLQREVIVAATSAEVLLVLLRVKRVLQYLVVVGMARS